MMGDLFLWGRKVGLLIGRGKKGNYFLGPMGYAHFGIHTELYT